MASTEQITRNRLASLPRMAASACGIKMWRNYSAWWRSETRWISTRSARSKPIPFLARQLQQQMQERLWAVSNEVRRKTDERSWFLVFSRLQFPAGVLYFAFVPGRRDAPAGRGTGRAAHP